MVPVEGIASCSAAPGCRPCRVTYALENHQILIVLLITTAVITIAVPAMATPMPTF